MAHNVKKIAEQYGYQFCIRRSLYHDRQDNVFIKSASYECAQNVSYWCLKWCKWWIFWQQIRLAQFNGDRPLRAAQVASAAHP